MEALPSVQFSKDWYRKSFQFKFRNILHFVWREVRSLVVFGISSLVFASKKEDRLILVKRWEIPQVLCRSVEFYRTWFLFKREISALRLSYNLTNFELLWLMASVYRQNFANLTKTNAFKVI